MVMVEHESNVFGDTQLYNEIEGVDDDEVLTGTDDADWINAGLGNDTIYGGVGGRDMLAGNAGNDTIYAGALGEDGKTIEYNGKDVEMYGGEGSDKLYGGTGDDWLMGDSDATVIGDDGLEHIVDGGDDEIHGGDGDDIILGGMYHTKAIGSGKDTLYGEGGDDTLYGGDDDDTLVGGVGDDDLYGGAGNDIFIYSKGDGNDVIYDASSDDTIQFTDLKFSDLHFVRYDHNLCIEIERTYNEKYNRWDVTESVMIQNYFDDDGNVTEGMIDKIVASGKTYSIGNNAEILNEKVVEHVVSRVSDEFIYFEEGLYGTPDDDTLTATANKTSWVMGNDGNDTISGVSGYNYLDGGYGDDTITGGTDFNEIYGGAGADTITGGKSGNYIWGDNVAYDGRNWVMVDHADGDTITGGAGDDVIFGGSRLDVINARGSGDDIIDGGNGNDTIWGGDGDDTITGGAGKDTFNYTVGDMAGYFGDDVITDATKDDRIVFNTMYKDNEGWIPSDTQAMKLYFYREGDNLLISTINGTICLENFMKNKSSNNLDTISFDEYAGLEDALEDFSILRDAVIYVYREEGDGGYKGTDYSEHTATLEGNETFTMGKGHNIIAIKGGGEKIINLTKGEILDINFGGGDQYTVSVDGKDLIITRDDGSTTVRIKNGAVENGATVYLDGYDVTEYYFVDYNVYNSDALAKGKLKGTNVAEYIDARGFDSKNGVKGVTVDSKAGNDTIVGSNYNDTIKSSSGDNFVWEEGGVNKITLGKGNDQVGLSGNTSNTVKVGNGINAVMIETSGTNKITGGKDDDGIFIYNGRNTVNTGKGESLVLIQDGENKITGGKDSDVYYIGGGLNTIKSGNGKDVFNVGRARDIDISEYFPDYEPESISDYGSYNIIKAGNGGNTFNLTSEASTNIITSGKGVDIFHVEYGTNYLDGGKGNDIYDLSKLYFYADYGKTIIMDKKGANVLDFGRTNVDVFFDVTVGKKGKAVYDSVRFVDRSLREHIADYAETVFEWDSVSAGKNCISTVNGLNFDVSGLASEVASWLQTNGYSSTADVFAHENHAGDIDVLIAKYTYFADTHLTPANP